MVKTDKKMELVVKTYREVDPQERRVLLGCGVGAAVAVWGRRAVPLEPRDRSGILILTYRYPAIRSSSCLVIMVTPPVAKLATSAPAFPISGELSPARKSSSVAKSRYAR
jgi:hypothetical protein